MKTTSQILIAIFFLIMVSCSDKTGDESGSVAGTCKVMSVYYNDDSARTYHYDASGKLILKWDLTEQGPDMLSTHYFYQNNRLAYSYMSSTDSTFYTYDSQGRISSYERHLYGMGIVQIRTTVFTYNSLNQVITEVFKVSLRTGNKGISSTDSTVYTYLGQNVRSRDYYSWTDPTYIIHYHYEYVYDSGNNYHAITGEPPIKYYQWSRNNTIGMSIDGYPSSTDTIRQYNSQGYPVLIQCTQGYNIILNYSCQ